MKKRWIAFTLGVVMTGVLLTGCGTENKKSSSDSATSDIQSSKEVESGKESNVVYGKVTKVNGSQVTYQVLERDGNGPGGKNGKAPEGSAKPEGTPPADKKEDAEPDGTPPAKPEGSAKPDGTPPAEEKKNGKSGDDKGGMMGFVSTGETKTLTLEDGIAIKKITRDGSSDASTEDITEGTMIQIQYSDEGQTTISQIGIQSMEQEKSNTNTEKN